MKTTRDKKGKQSNNNYKQLAPSRPDECQKDKGFQAQGLCQVKRGTRKQLGLETQARIARQAMANIGRVLIQ